MSPASDSGPPRIPHGRTAQRLEWRVLPPHVRAEVERRCGSRVVGAESQGSGFTPAFAAVLTCEDGSRHFVKAAAAKAQRAFAESHRREAQVLRALPRDVRAPRLLWSLDDDWVVLGLRYVDAHPPARPWTPDALDASLDLLEELADRLTPAPSAVRAPSFVEECRSLPRLWERVRAVPPDLPGLAEHLDDAVALARGFAEVSGGDTLLHNDLRDDNLLLDARGRAWACDWNWVCTGAGWIDAVALLIGPYGDGLDVESVLASRGLTADVPAAHVDAVLALVCGYYLGSAVLPVPPASPYLRDAQRWLGEAAWGWLAERQGWAKSRST